MSQSILINSFLPQVIIESRFSDLVPEYYQLKEVIESQGWHDNQSVFNHSIASAQALESIARLTICKPLNEQV